MKIINTTGTIQRLWIRDILKGTSVQVEVLPKEPRELGNSYIPDTSMDIDFDKKFKIGGVKSETTTPIEEESPSIDTEEQSPQEDIEEGIKENAPETLEDKFICDICGAEFASARGLNSHKNRSHAE